MTILRAGVAELSILHRDANRVVGLGAVGGNDDAFAGSETVGLDDDGQAELAARNHLVRIVCGVADAKPGGGNSVARHERLGERLAALELGGGARRAEDAVASIAKAIDETAIERQLGADDCEVEQFAIGKRAQLVDGARVDGEKACVGRDPRVSRRASD